MAQMIKVKQVQGRDSLMEDGQEWPTHGVLVEKSLYVRRRLIAGDIVEVEGRAKAVSEATSDKTVKGDK